MASSTIFTEDELRLLKHTPINIMRMFEKIPREVVHTLSTMKILDSFTIAHVQYLEEKNTKLNQQFEAVNKKLQQYVGQIENADIKQLLEATIALYRNVPHTNHFANPLVAELEKGDDGASSEVSLDMGFSGENGEMNCWRLEENSRSDGAILSLTDIFDHNLTKTKLPAHLLTSSANWSKDHVDEKILHQLTDELVKLGFAVYFVDIRSWRKGYNYEIYDMRNGTWSWDKVFGSECDYFRIYVV